MRITCTKTAGMQLSHISEQLPTREPGTRKDPFAVAVVRSSVTVSQQLYVRTIDCMSVHVGPHYWFNCVRRWPHPTGCG